MSLSELVIKIIGIILAVVGLELLLALVGLSFIPGTGNIWLNLIFGVFLLGAGIYIIKGGNIRV